MASIRKRGDKWHVQVRRQGQAALTKSFTRKSAADAWARQCEAALDVGDVPPATAVLRLTTFGSLLDRYEREVVPRKKGWRTETYFVKAIRARAIGNTTLDLLTTGRFATYRDERLASVCASSVRREFDIIRHCLDVAIREWECGLRVNPVTGLRLPPPGPSRERRVTAEELQRLAVGLRETQNPLVRSIINMALATGMRRSEILGVTWADVDTTHRLIRLHDTKNGSPRSVPLSPFALSVLQGLPEGNKAELVFPMSANALRLSWVRLKRRCDIEDLRFHDLRHEAVSRFFEAGLGVPEVALISGHKDPRMLFRYTHLRPEAVAARLANLKDDGVTERTL